MTGANAEAPTTARLNTDPNRIVMMLSKGVRTPERSSRGYSNERQGDQKNQYSPASHLHGA